MKGYPDAEERSEIGTSHHHDRTCPHEQQQASMEDFHPPVAKGAPRVPGANSFAQPNSFYPAGYRSPSPGWPPSIAGRSESFTLVDSAAGSRSSVRSWQTERQTPVDSTLSTRHGVSFPTDSGPSTPMNQSHISLTGLLKQAQPPAGGKDWTEHGGVEIVHKRDDSNIWKGWRRRLFRLVPFLTVVNTAFYFIYLGLRIACVVSAQKTFQTTYHAAWLFIAVEIAVALPSLLHNSWTVMSVKKRYRPKLRLRGEDVPTVDVFVTCCGEDDDLVMDTVRGACDVDYPYDKFRVIVLDDGKSETLEAAISRLATSHCNLYYMAREKIPGRPHHFKAGNLNYGLEQSRLLPGGAGQFMAALDADMIPEREWLRATLPHLLIDSKMALACPPQLFYNTPPSDPLSQSLNFFVHVIEPIKDSLGVAWCTGSGYVVRREALDEIGNFPLGSLAEDVATSSLMLGKGWKTAYVHEPLQFGTVPGDFGSHLKQRTRWAIGTVDTSFKLNFCLWGEKVRKMTAAQRFSGFLYATLSLHTILVSISMFGIPVILIMGKALVAYATEEQLRWLIRACFVSTISNRLWDFVLFAPAGYHTGQRESRYQLWMSPYIALCLIRSFLLPKWLGGQVQAFKPTGSLASALNERHPALKKNMVRRLWTILVNYMGFFHLAFVYTTLVGVVLTSYRCFVRTDSTRSLLLCLVTHAFWPPLTFMFLCSSAWTPVAYAIDPPQIEEREHLLVRDPKTMVAHPTAKSKKIAFGGQAAWFEFELTTSTIYTGLIFALSFVRV
ncbi:Glycosyl transferase, family 2 [Metarhizium album ARSEF 1941]|uniref:Glycosyl transferase, family 2 n=1 Tax=Metarhizium album (strain ARSEF 1941) TaxID=1081103 RepID=A0A0B2WUU9_METAS|nr:Glycosyl transferase, family 2 [Metarhizium album ARSEF 1941]KHN99841.1 Glycosyl transferase, family 2 [Metarhizium album ARSEF 1941]